MQATNQTIQVGTCAVTFQIHSLLWNLKEPRTPSSCLLSKPICFFIPSCPSKAAVAASVRKAFLMDVGRASLWHPDAFTLFPFPWDVDGGDSRQQMHCGIIGGFLLQGAEYQTHGNLKKKIAYFLKSSFLIRTLETLACWVGSRRGSANSGSWVKSTPRS